MATEELGKLSPEQIRKLAKTISEAKNLTSQQEEIIQKVLDGETEIGELRISYLDQYFDTYSKKLDEIVARKTSDLNDIFLILDNKLNSSYNTLSSNIDKLKGRLADIEVEGSNEQQKSQKDTANTNTKALVDTALHMLADAYKKESEARAKIIGSSNSELLALEKQYHEQRYAQLKQHLNNIVNVTTEYQSKQVAELDTTSQLTETSHVQDSSNATVLHNNDVADITDAIREASKLSEEASAQQQEWKAYTPKDIDENLSSITNNKSQSASASSYLAATDTGGDNLDISRLSGDSTENVGADEAKIADITEANDTSSKIAKVITNFINDLSKLKSLENLDIANMAEDQKNVFSEFLKDIEKLRKENADELTETEKNIAELRKQMAELELARSREEQDVKLRANKLQLEQLESVLKAELKAQNLINQIDLQLSELNQRDAEEVSATRAKGINANRDAEAAEILQKQMADFRAKLDAESMAKNGGVLSDVAALDNDNAVRERFKNYEQRLAEIKATKATTDNIDPRIIEENEKRKVAIIAKLELQHKKKNHGEISALERQAIKERADEEFKLSDKNLKRLQKEQLKNDKEEQKAERKEHRQKTDSIISAPLTKENSLLDHIKDLKKASDEKTAHGSGGEKLVAALDTAIVAVSSLLTKLDKTIDEIASYKGTIDTRLQGSKNEQSSGSYWGQLTKDMMSVGAVTPFFKQEKFAENIKSLVDQGIAFDLKQRAFLMTIQEKIANTFNVADGTLLRLIRIQQEDSTAGRLGMESALNSFLNNMYENTEYLKTVAEGVRSSLQEMEALMSGAEATEVEYQVQKWMGSLYSVGMSQEAVNGIATALGQIAAGQVDALTNGSGAGNLLVMAANQAGKSISEILTEGLDANETNQLLKSAVNYLAELYESSKDSRVVQQQLASVYGVKASDLRAAVNLASDGSTDNVFKEYLTYDNMLSQLNDMAGTMHLRTSLGEMMQNVWANGQYTLASSMANNPAAYLLYKVASLLDATTGGIAIPAISAAGFGVDLETTVADLMRVASVSTGIIGSFGSMISGLSNSFSGQSMLSQMGIEQGSGLKVNIRGTGEGITASDSSGGGAKTTSESGYVGNSSGSDIKESTMQEAEDSKKKHMIEAIEEEQAHQIDYINENVLKIYELLDEVTSGKRNFNVKVAGYGLTTKIGGSELIVGPQGGVGGQLNVGTGNTNSSAGGVGSSIGSSTGSGFGGGQSSSGNSGSGHNSGYTSSGGSGSDYSVTKGIDLGGWTMM